jgi:cytochrome c553
MEGILELELKQKLSQLSETDQRSISAYLLRLRQSSEESKNDRSMLMREMDQGQKTPLSNLCLD